MYSTSRCQTHIWKRKCCFQYVVIEAQTAGKLHSSGLSAGGQREGGGQKEGFIDPEKLLNCCSGWAGACLWPPLQLTIYTILNCMDLLQMVTQDRNVKTWSSSDQNRIFVTEYCEGESRFRRWQVSPTSWASGTVQLSWQWSGNALGSFQETLLLQYWLQSVLCLTDSSARRITN